MFLNDDEKRLLLNLARHTLGASFEPDPRRPLDELMAQKKTLTGGVSAPHPCFVSLFEKRERLRGCIGTLVTSAPLYQNVHHFTRQAAFHDPRFEPVGIGEIPRLSIRISVLGPSEPLPSLEKLVLGRHGLTVRGLGRQGVLLAEVATKFGWSKERFLEETCLKAGLPPEGVAGYEVRYYEEVSFAEQAQRS